MKLTITQKDIMKGVRLPMPQKPPVIFKDKKKYNRKRKVKNVEEF